VVNQFGGYAQSKWVCEQRLKAATALYPFLRVNIYRLGMISADLFTGCCNLSDWLYRYVVGCILIGGYFINRSRSLPVLNTTPLDHASAFLLKLISSSEESPSAGATASLHQIPISASIDAESFMQQFSAASSRFLGRAVRSLGKAEWAQRLSSIEATNPLFPFKDTFFDGLGEISGHKSDATVQQLSTCFQSNSENRSGNFLANSSFLQAITYFFPQSKIYI
jgi:thioester reductase-like protein